MSIAPRIGPGHFFLLPGIPVKDVLVADAVEIDVMDQHAFGRLFRPAPLVGHILAIIEFP